MTHTGITFRHYSILIAGLKFYCTEKYTFPKMLFSKGLIKLVILNIRQLKFHGINLFSIDPASFKLYCNYSNVFKTKLFCRYAVVTLMVSATLAQIIVFGGRFPSARIYEGLLYVVFMLSFLATLFVTFSKNIQAQKLFNSLVELEQELVHGKFIFQKKIQTYA